MPLDAMALKVREYGKTGMLFASVKLWSRKPDARKIIGAYWPRRALSFTRKILSVAIGTSFKYLDSHWVPGSPSLFFQISGQLAFMKDK